MRTGSDRMFGRVLLLDSKQRTSASFCYLSNIYVFQYVTQCGTCTCTRQNSLNFIMPRFYTNAYIGTGSSCMNIGHFNRRALIQPGQLRRLEGRPTNLKVAGSSQNVGKYFLFCIFFSVFHAFLASQLSP